LILQREQTESGSQAGLYSMGKRFSNALSLRLTGITLLDVSDLPYMCYMDHPSHPLSLKYSVSQWNLKGSGDVV
jgi:hypothetical protein